MKDSIDDRLIALLTENSRQSISELARKLAVSRATVNEHIQRLEHQGIISGFTIRLGQHYARQQVGAYMMISLAANKSQSIVRQLHKIDALKRLSTISGQYDLIAYISTDSTESLDSIIDDIALLDGVQHTLSHIVLSRKIDR